MFEVVFEFENNTMNNSRRKIKVEAGCKFALNIHKRNSEKHMKFEFMFELENKTITKCRLLIMLSTVR